MMKFKLLFFLFFFSIFSSIAYAKVLFPLYPDHGSKQETEKFKFLEKHWSSEKFSNPLIHSDSDYMYIVNVIDGMALGAWGNTRTHFFGKLLSSDPQKISGNYKISSSVISSKYRTFFQGHLALILDAPTVNLGPMAPEDMAAVQQDNYEQAVKYFKNVINKEFSKIYTPADLIEATKARRKKWNEVLILGTNHSQLDKTGGFKKVKAKGLIIKCDNWDEFISKSGLNLSSKIKSMRIDLAQDFKRASQCLLGDRRAKRYHGYKGHKGIAELKESLLALEAKEKLMVYEKRMLYLVNFYQYVSKSNSKFPVILYSF
jgi:hypothetical protein